MYALFVVPPFGLPRVSGGVSLTFEADGVEVESSPRKRGCFPCEFG